MITHNETTPLLGESSTPGISPSRDIRKGVDRVHFLDNLRSVLTVLLIFHHAAIFSARDSMGAPPYYRGSNMLPLALFITTNKSFLYQTFFFVSGYSIRLGLTAKSDSAFFVSRTLKTGLPALIWLLFGRKLAVHLLLEIFGVRAFGRFILFGSDQSKGQFISNVWERITALPSAVQRHSGIVWVPLFTV